MLSSFIDGFSSSLNTYFGGLNSSSIAAYNDQIGPLGHPSLADADGFFTALSAPLLLGLLGLSAVVAIVVVVLSDISLGAGFLVGLLLTIILGVLPIGDLLPGISALSTFTASTFSGIWALVNSTSSGDFGPIQLMLSTSGVFNQFATDLVLIADVGAITIDPYAIAMLGTIQSSMSNAVYGLCVVLACAGLVAFFSFWEVEHHVNNVMLDAFFLCAATICVVAALSVLKTAIANGFKEIAALVVGVSTLDLVSTLAKVGVDLG